jgi:hypothetical protein
MDVRTSTGCAACERNPGLRLDCMRNNAMQTRTGMLLGERENIEKSEPRTMRANPCDWPGRRNFIATVT